jgi:hypothetical protein
MALFARVGKQNSFEKKCFAPCAMRGNMPELNHAAEHYSRHENQSHHPDVDRRNCDG